MKKTKLNNILSEIILLVLTIVTLSACGGGGSPSSKTKPLAPLSPSNYRPTAPLMPLNPALRPINPPLSPINPPLDPIFPPIKPINPIHALWAKQVGESDGITQGYGISADHNDNSYVTGTTDIGISGESQNGKQDYFVAKHDESGNLLWAKQVGAKGGTTIGWGITTDQNNNSYVIGSTTLGISGRVQHGKEDYFIAKYNESGNEVWTRQIGNTDDGHTAGFGITADKNGNSYVVGTTTAGIFGQSQHGYEDYIIVKYDESGNEVWAKQIGESKGYSVARSVKVDKNGNSYIAGWTTVGLSGESQNGLSDFFVTKYDKDGKLVWAKQVGAKNGNAEASDINISQDDNIYITGDTDTTLAESQFGTIDLFVAKYDEFGNKIMLSQHGESGGFTRGSGIGLDSNNNVYVSGSTNIDLNGHPHNADSYFFVTKADNTGKILWDDGSEMGYSEANGIAVTQNGNFYTIGHTDISIFGQKKRGLNDYFIVKYH
ncbi:MAG: SBBP repeat-containing protein [Neisseriaceae bacterium]